MASTYSFADVLCAITGPGGNLSLSEGGVADEGITVEMNDDKSSMVPGADGSWMHSLHVSNSGRVVLRLLKTSELNQRLTVMYNYQTASSANHGRNLISVRNPAVGMSITCEGCAFKKLPPNVNAKDGGTNEWAFDSGRITQVLGSGDPSL
ncbi:phage protein [Methylobacterium sp. WL19]|uniref:phage protein n=1 Tax=Methylobacterium sp. WL19 TaxID=2603896 RepID=UPI0011C7FE5C|nr:phage protein [Methylobacterium sp. WL19]TXN33900.1 DUF3277 family protein [Methylobacterium sp. WL19]